MYPVYDVLLIVLISFYVMLAPYTKVEESFNIQALHDMIYYGFDVSKYDHIDFPGVVPRTFIGSLTVYAVLKPVLRFIPLAATKLDGQMLGRAVLGLFNALGIFYLKNSAINQINKNQKNPVLTKKEPSKVKTTSKHKSVVQVKKKPVEIDEPHTVGSFNFWFALIQFTQFHIVFYSSRTLPNFFALPLTNYAFGNLFSGNYLYAIGVLAFTTIVFRIEIVALMLSVGFFLYLYNKVTIPQLVKASLIGGSIGAVMSGLIDSYFWQRWTIPELESFIFNVIQGKSAEWGTEPFTRYFSGYLFTIFVPPLAPLLAVLGGWFDITGNDTLKLAGISSFLYVVLISFQSHKEWRFLAYVIPVVNVLAANGASYITWKASKSIWYKLLVLVMLGNGVISLIFSGSWAYVSSYNYPGGEALAKLHEKLMMSKIQSRSPDHLDVTVHFDVASAMSGITRFGELTDILNITVTYDKTEDPEVLKDLWPTFDYIIIEDDLSNKRKNHSVPFLENWRWKKVDVIKGFGGLDVKGIRHLNPPAFFHDLITQRSISPFLKVIKPFIHLVNKSYIYQRVPAPAKEDKPTVAEPAVTATEVVDKSGTPEIAKAAEDRVEQVSQEVTHDTPQEVLQNSTENPVEELIEELMEESKETVQEMTD